MDNWDRGGGALRLSGGISATLVSNSFSGNTANGCAGDDIDADTAATLACSCGLGAIGVGNATDCTSIAPGDGADTFQVCAPECPNCVVCEPGTLWADGVCGDCPPGTYNPFPALVASECTTCPADTYNPTGAGASRDACLPCVGAQAGAEACGTTPPTPVPTPMPTVSASPTPVPTTPVPTVVSLDVAIPPPSPPAPGAAAFSLMEWDLLASGAVLVALCALAGVLRMLGLLSCGGCARKSPPADNGFQVEITASRKGATKNPLGGGARESWDMY